MSGLCKKFNRFWLEVAYNNMVYHSAAMLMQLTSLFEILMRRLKTKLKIPSSIATNDDVGALER